MTLGMAMVIIPTASDTVRTVFFLRRRRKQLAQTENRAGLSRTPKRANRNVEHRSDPHIGRVGPLDPPVLVPGPTVETAWTTRTPLQALEHYFPRGVHPRAVHGHSPTLHRT